MNEHLPPGHDRDHRQAGSITPEADGLLEPSRPPIGSPNAALRSISDELLLHGVLSMLAEGEPAAMELRIATAMDAIGRMAPTTAARAEAPRPDGSAGRHRRWNTRVLAGSGAFAAILLLALTATLFVRTTPTATAALTQIVEAGRSVAFRRYECLMDRSGGVRDGAPPAIPFRRGHVDVGPAGRFVCTFEGPAGKPALIMGFDGTEYWLVPPVGPVRIGVSPGPIAKVAELGGDLDQLMLRPMVESLRRHYVVRFAPDGALEGGTGPIRLEALRRPNRPGPRPEHVRLAARRSDFAIVEFEARWSANDGPQRMSGLRLRLVEATDPGADWFSRRRHHDPARPVVEMRDGDDRRPPRFDGPRGGRPARPDRERPGRPGGRSLPPPPPA